MRSIRTTTSASTHSNRRARKLAGASFRFGRSPRNRTRAALRSDAARPHPSSHQKLGTRAIAALCGVLGLGMPLGCRDALPPPTPAAHGPDFPPGRGGTLNLATFEDIRGLDPAGPADGLALQAEHLLFAGLVDFDDTGRLVPDLATMWSVEDQGRTFRFSLREGVTMHDGEELTADDVVRSVERALNPTTPNPNASYFTNISGYDAYVSSAAEHLTGVAADGRYVVTFHLKEADATFLRLTRDAHAEAGVPHGGRSVRRYLGPLRGRSFQDGGRRLATRYEPAARPARRVLPPGIALPRRRRMDVSGSSPRAALPLRGWLARPTRGHGPTGRGPLRERPAVARARNLRIRSIGLR